LTHTFQKLGIATRAELTTRFTAPEPPGRVSPAREATLATP
jgi:hypothetical protein